MNSQGLAGLWLGQMIRMWQPCPMAQKAVTYYYDYYQSRYCYCYYCYHYDLLELH